MVVRPHGVKITCFLLKNHFFTKNDENLKKQKVFKMSLKTFYFLSFSIFLLKSSFEVKKPSIFDLFEWVLSVPILLACVVVRGGALRRKSSPRHKKSLELSSGTFKLPKNRYTSMLPSLEPREKLRFLENFVIFQTFQTSHIPIGETKPKK